MSCRLMDYYKEDVFLNKSIEIILGFINKDKGIIDKVVKDYPKE